MEKMMEAPLMRIDILTLFPESVEGVLHGSILGRAMKRGILDIRCTQIRDYTDNRQNQVDDYPYGGGFGCVMMAQPLKACLDAVIRDAGERRRRVIYLSPQGKPFTQETARRLERDYDHLALVCGHYEGVDERFIEACVDEEISLGDFVLTGGEIAAMAVADAVCRLVPGVLSDPQCYIGESHWDGLLEYPQYTRPECWEDRKVPEVLVQGDHARVESWRRLKQLERTRDKRPDLFAAFRPQTKEDRELLMKLQERNGRKCLTEPVSCRAAGEADLPALQLLANGAEASCGEKASKLLPDAVQQGECFCLLHGDELAGCFVLSSRKEPLYEQIRDGKWSDLTNACTLRFLCVDKEYRGSGIAGEILRQIYAKTIEAGCRCVRTDIPGKKKTIQKFLRENGFRYRGNLILPDKAPYQCYEIIYKEKKA